MERASADEAMAKAAKEARRFREQLEEISFGSLSLFRREFGDSAAVPVGAGSVVVSGVGADMPVGDADALWAFLKGSTGRPGQAVPIGGLPAGVGGSCLLVVVQILLRLPAVAVWLARHCESCPDSISCLACALWRCRDGLGTEACGWMLESCSALLGSVPGVFGSAGVPECFAAVVAELHRIEIGAARAGDWPGVSNRPHGASHVDRIFAFVEEQRLLCEHCGGSLPKVVWNARHVLACLDVVVDQRLSEKVWTATELAFKWSCSPQRMLLCDACGEGRVRSQVRVAAGPNVLVLRVARGGRGPRYGVVPEREFALPGRDRMALFAVMYRIESGGPGARDCCVVKGECGRWWRYEGNSFRVFTVLIPVNSLAGFSIRISWALRARLSA